MLLLCDRIISQTNTENAYMFVRMCKTHPKITRPTYFRDGLSTEADGYFPYFCGVSTVHRQEWFHNIRYRLLVASSTVPSHTKCNELVLILEFISGAHSDAKHLNSVSLKSPD